MIFVTVLYIESLWLFWVYRVFVWFLVILYFLGDRRTERIRLFIVRFCFYLSLNGVKMLRLLGGVDFGEWEDIIV